MLGLLTEKLGDPQPGVRSACAQVAGQVIEAAGPALVLQALAGGPLHSSWRVRESSLVLVLEVLYGFWSPQAH